MNGMQEVLEEPADWDKRTTVFGQCTDLQLFNSRETDMAVKWWREVNIQHTNPPIMTNLTSLDSVW